MRRFVFHLLWNLLAWLTACSLPAQRDRNSLVRIDGSSTVFPITEAITERFFEEQPQFRVVVGVSGTGGGLRKLLRDEIDICNASRPISAQEKAQFDAAGIELIELPLAHDGIVVVVHPSNQWANHISLAELKRLWQTSAQGEATRWSDLRKGWPTDRVVLFGAGPSSGTYDFFTEAVLGKARAGRGDYAFSENDNILVSGVAGDKYALGYVGYGYFAENRDRLKALAIDNGQGEAILPSRANIVAGVYRPLSRLQYLYVRRSALQKEAVLAYLRFYNREISQLEDVPGLLPLADSTYACWSVLLEEAVPKP